MLLLRWLAASFALFNAYRHGNSRGRVSFFTGIGCLFCARGFACLPLILLPRLTVALAGFFTAGCQFEGEQRAFSEAWFAIYPALAEVMLFYYSVLNLVAKGLGRRMSDALFGPSLLAFCLLHHFRRTLSNARWYEFDGRIATVMTAHEYEKLRLVDLFTTDAAFRLNGNVRSIFVFKLVVLALNLLPLIFSKKITKQPWVSSVTNGDKQDASAGTTIERALGVKASESSGLGLSSIYIHEMQEPHRYLNAYEFVRLGYVVFGDSFVIPLTDWLVFVPLALVQLRRRPFGFRVMAFRLVLIDESPTHVRCDVEADKLQLYQLHEPACQRPSAPRRCLDIETWLPLVPSKTVYPHHSTKYDVYPLSSHSRMVSQAKSCRMKMGVDRRDRSASLDSLGRRKRRSDRPRGRADSLASSSSSRGSRSPSRSRHVGSRSSRHRSSRHHSRSRSRERGRERGDREGRGRRDDRRRRSNSRGRSRSRSRSAKQRHPRSRSRSEELHRGGKDQRAAKPHSDDAREDHSGTHEAEKEAAAPAVEAPASQLSEEEQMRMMLGFGDFDSTKGKAVDDNLQGAALGAARKEAKREYRQYMNRRGGFNRPLDQR